MAAFLLEDRAGKEKMHHNVLEEIDATHEEIRKLERETAMWQARLQAQQQQEEPAAKRQKTDAAADAGGAAAQREELENQGWTA